MQNTAILDGLKDYRGFVVFRLEPGQDGKSEKIPTHPTTGQNIDGQDPAQWMLPYDALAWANHLNAQPWPAHILGYGVGIVIHADSGLFCVDIDHCRDPSTGALQPHAQNFRERFPNAYWEISVSATGAHIIGRTKLQNRHRTRNKLYRMECYTRARFIALTGNGAEGNVNADCTRELTAFLGEFFPDTADIEHGLDWTDAPVAAWHGPQDDEALIALAMRARGIRVAMGKGTAFADLWTANDDILSKAFPPTNAYDTWNRSDADLALSNHLAFWTGNDCERMARLMRESGLMRDKLNREDYMHRTVLKSTGSQREWYNQKTAEGASPETLREHTALDSVTSTVPPPPTEGVPPPPMVPAPPAAAPTEWRGADGKPKPGSCLTVQETIEFLKDFRYVHDMKAMQFPDGTVARKEQFDDIIGGGVTYALSYAGEATDSAWKAFHQNKFATRFPRVDRQYFNPQHEPNSIRTYYGRTEVNSYFPVDIPRKRGDPAPFLDLLHRMLPVGNDANILLWYMAACVQNLGKKFAWCPFIQGTRGNGKTTVGRIMEYCMSYQYTHWAKADQLGEKFNAFLYGRLFIIIDEMYADDRKEFEEILKQLVTARRLEVRPMYGEKAMRDMVFNMMLFSNYQNGVRIDPDERRYAAFFCAQQTKADKLRDGMTNAYFKALNAWLEHDGFAIVYDYLLTLEIPDEYNPAVDCLVAPETSSTELAATASLGGAEQEILEAIKQGVEGFRGGWVSSSAVDLLMAKIGKDRSVSRNARRSMLINLGYVLHPSLKDDGRITMVMPDGSRPRFYVKRGHPWEVDHLDSAQVLEGFLLAQRA
jgi:hypothetical protein